MITYKDVEKSDKNYEYFFGDMYTLMENAGRSVAGSVSKEFGCGNKILTVCGVGNNAGDGLVASSILSATNGVMVYFVKGRESLRGQHALKALSGYKGKIIEESQFENSLKEADVVLDAIFGSGFNGTPRSPFDDVITKMNSSGKKIVSVDVPSALGSEVAIHPFMTVTFTDVKEGMNEQNSGKIVIADIGIPEKAFKYAGPGDFVYYRLPEVDSHKGMNGVVAIVAGWTFYGSGIISASGAVKAGADLVRIYSNDYNRVVLSSYDPQIIVRPIDDKTLVDMEKSNSILIGPGLGKGQDISPILSHLKEFSGVVVVDADGLDLLSVIRKELSKPEIIITPHHGEFERISGTKPTEENAIAFSKKFNIVIILKGLEDLVVFHDKVIRVEGGNPRMTMGGTGDLLAGLTTAISARSSSAFESACMASLLNKTVGDLCYKEKSYWYDINDMIEKIPEAMKILLKK
ncbi:MAG: NAD(P)H-hydrate dehydratase [Thermoplasmatales archaeon]|nr:NAD(P)H-hydrate dehydratase [Thermoplasmatales archaeon]MCW6171160.1 NAD(P)H-hydrate dehydratase [Thermoplasmatales archaeon]